jgi:cell surface protein SprA
MLVAAVYAAQSHHIYTLLPVIKHVLTSENKITSSAAQAKKLTLKRLKLPHFPEDTIPGKNDTTTATQVPGDTTRTAGGGNKDTMNMHYPVAKTGESSKTMDLDNPPAIQHKVELDSSMKYYKVSDKVGNTSVGDEKQVPYDEYQKQQEKKYIQDYFKRRSQAQTNTGGKSILPKLNVGNDFIDNLINQVEIRPQGSAELIFSEDFNRVANPTWSIQEQRNSQFKFDQKIQVSVIGSIGDRFKLGINYNTQANFDFENQRKLAWQGKEDEIVKSIQVGDVSMPVSSALITGSQSLFGVKAQLQFGKLDVTAVFAQQKSQSKSITLEGGSQRTKYNLTADSYDPNRHYLLGHFFKEQYDFYNSQWPALSDIQVTKIEVWVTNTSLAVTNTRSVVAFTDLGENTVTNPTWGGGNPQGIYPPKAPIPGSAPPDNNANGLFNYLKGNASFRSPKTVAQALTSGSGHGMTNTIDYYVLTNARMLSTTEYSYNAKLGYINLNTTLNPGDVLAVAYQYTKDGIVHQVGEFSSDVPPNSTTNGQTNVLYLKMLKSVVAGPAIRNWKLMMKNIYSLGTYQVQASNFQLQVVYNDPRSGAYLNYIPEESERINGEPLIRLLGMDRLNTQQQPKPDGNFDYLEGVTINSSNGQIIFPVLEPFGSDLAKSFSNPALASKYSYQVLYDSIRAFAIQQADKNRFFLQGFYTSSSGSDISLGAINVPQGSVKVFAGGIPLTEGVDYTVDYTLGKVKIINAAILNSGSVIKVESESNTLFSVQQKTMMGTHMDYHFNKDLTIGTTAMYLRERPLTPKVNVGDEPIRNAVWGMDGHYRKDSRFLTALVDAIPLIQTKEKSTVTVDGEYARIFPGHPSTLNNAGGSGVSYIDDFEGSQVPYDLRLGNNWVLASVPQGHPERPAFHDASVISSDKHHGVNDFRYGFTRAKMAWYIIDNIFFLDNNLTPPNIKGNNTLLSNNYQRRVNTLEVYPNKQLAEGDPGILQTFDLYYNPRQRGQYNFTVAGLDNQGNLKNPSSSWAGIQRSLQTTDFETANIEYIQFWLMDPFSDPKMANHHGGDLYINLGTISEDILRDGRESYENGLPLSDVVQGVDTTGWAIVPNGIHLTTAFSNDPNARKHQDVGYDGLDDVEEGTFFHEYLDTLKTVNPSAYARIAGDPSADNFHFFRGSDLDAASADIITRYSNYNNTQGNTPVESANNNGYGSQYPDDEDINRDFNIETTENYYEYHISLRPQDLTTIGRNFITDRQRASVNLANGKNEQIYWYQFKVPIRNYTGRVGDIQDFKSIRFMRMYFTDFADSIICRFGSLQLVRSDWRIYQYSLKTPGENISTDTIGTTLQVSSVNLEENGKRQGIPYVIPPGIQRQIDYSTPNLIQQNEQSMDLKVCNLKPGEGQAIFKNTSLDIRMYKTIRMFVHAESPDPRMQDKDMHLFIRVGADFNSNYYEYDIPLYLTKRGTTDPALIWPTNNEINLSMAEWTNVKQQRRMIGGSLTIPYTTASEVDGSTVSVLGNPDLGNVRAVMIGIRNPKLTGSPLPCAEVWVDELRVTDFNEKGGWAATGRITAKLADFGRIEVTGSETTIGYGSIDQTLQQRSQSNTLNYGMISSFELGKFFPKKYNVRIPMYFSYSQQIITPKYNPLSPDLPFSTISQVYTDKARQDSALKAGQDITTRKSLNFTGVQKLRSSNAKGNPKIYDIENFNATFIYSEIYHTNITNVFDFEKDYAGQLGYAYTFKAKEIRPFKSIKSKQLKLISDFNFYNMPQSFTVTARMDRKFAEKLYRGTPDIETINQPMFDKTFTFGRKYDFRYNITRSLRLTYSGVASSRIDEPDGAIDTREKKDTIWNNIKKLGTPVSFSQSTNLTYDVPVNKLPYMDWTSLQTSYTANYDWRSAPPAALQYGNTVQNAQTITANGQLNFVQLYNKSPFLRNIIQGNGNQPKVKANKPEPTVKDTTEKKKPEKKTKKKKKKKKKRKNTNQTRQKQQEEEEAPPHNLSVGETMVGVLMSIRNVSVNYTDNNGQLLPGFSPVPQYLGEDARVSAPGFPFIFGSQRDIRPDAVRNGWLVTDTGLSAQYMTTHRESISGQATLEPIKGLRINVDFNRQQSTSFTETFRANSEGTFQNYSPIQTGNYAISILAISTSFASIKNNKSSTFDQFEANRITVAEQLAKKNPLSPQRTASDTFPRGYSKYNQDVLIPAFIAAYTGKSPTTEIFPKIPMPNWRITYSGLSNIKAFQDYIKQINLTNGYRATYTVDNYQTNLTYNPNQRPLQDSDLITKYRIDRVTIQESWSPLIGLDITFKNNWTARFQFNKDRTEALSFTDRRITETRGQEIVFGAGYRTNKLLLPFRLGGKKYTLNNDFTFRLDASIRDNRQIVRILDQPEGQATGGQWLFALTPNVTYVISKNLTVNIFFKRNVNKPYTSNQYPTSFTSIGFSLRYVLTP